MGTAHESPHAENVDFTPAAGLASTNVQGAIEEVAGLGGGGGASAFIDLTDCPAAIEPLKEVRGNAAGTGLVFGVPEFLLTYYDGAGDMKESSTGAATASTTNFSISASTVFGVFSASDVGKTIVIAGAGTAGAHHVTTIASRANDLQVTLAIPAVTTVSNAQVAWGTDNTTPLQNAIGAALPYSGEIVIQPGRHLFVGYEEVLNTVTSTKDVYNHAIRIRGSVTGPFDAREGYRNGSTFVRDYPLFVPMICPINLSSPFIKIRNTNCKIEDLAFYYPLQTRRSNTPVVYPPTIKVIGTADDSSGNPAINNMTSGFSIRRCTFFNAYDAIFCTADSTATLHVGRAFICENFIGSIRNGITFETYGDVVYTDNNHIWPFWYSVGQHEHGYDFLAWSQANGHGILCGSPRAEGLMISNLFVYGKYAIFKATAGVYGWLTNIGGDRCENGVIITSTPADDSLTISNYGTIGRSDLGGTGYALTVSGATANVKWIGGYIRLHGSNKVLKSSASSNVEVTSVQGYNPVGNVTAPSVPASDTNQANEFAHTCRVNVYGGTVTAIKIGGVATGLTSGSFVLYSGENISITYSSVPSWTWFGI